MIEEIRRVIRSSVGNRAKESLIVDFINNTNLDSYDDRTDVIKAFYEYAQAELKKEATDLIVGYNLNEEEAKHYIELSLKRKFASENESSESSVFNKEEDCIPENCGIY